MYLTICYDPVLVFVSNGLIIAIHKELYEVTSDKMELLLHTIFFYKTLYYLQSYILQFTRVYCIYLNISSVVEV